MMVGRLISFWVLACFQGRAVKLQECKKGRIIQQQRQICPLRMGNGSQWYHDSTLPKINMEPAKITPPKKKHHLPSRLIVATGCKSRYSFLSGVHVSNMFSNKIIHPSLCQLCIILSLGRPHFRTERVALMAMPPPPCVVLFLFCYSHWDEKLGPSGNRSSH